MRGVPLGGRRRGGGNQFFLLMMVARYLPALLEVKPAVTLAVGGFLAGHHFRLLGKVPYLYGRTMQDVCLMPGAILYDVELLRFVTGVVTHFSDYHLYWALGSLAAKGLALEPRIGSKNFGTLLLALTVMTSVVTVVLSFSMYNLLGDHGWMKNCYLGISPALFGLKPVSLALGGPERTSFFGFTMPSAHAVWFELLLVLMINPSGSFFFTHLCGIFAGYIWILLQEIGDFEAAVPEFLLGMFGRAGVTRPTRNRDWGTSTAEQQAAASGVPPPARVASAPPVKEDATVYAEVDAEEVRRRRMARFQ